MPFFIGRSTADKNVCDGVARLSTTCTRKRTAIARAVATAAIFAVAVFAAAPARSGEDDVYRELLRRQEAVGAELEYVLRGLDSPPETPDYPRRMLSIRKNADVTLGGELRTDYIGRRGSFVDPSFSSDSSGLRTPGRSKLADLTLATARLSFDARLGDRWRAFLDINLNGYNSFHKTSRLRNPNHGLSGSTADYVREEYHEDIREAYVEFLKGGHSGFGFKAGLMELPFGLSDRHDLIGRSFLDGPDLTRSYLMDPLARDNAVRLPHASRFTDPVVAVMLNYEMRDIIRFEAGVFQDREGWRRDGRIEAGAGRYRSDAPLPSSWQAGFSILPLEGWELSAQFRNRHSRSRGLAYWADSPYRWDFRGNLASGRSDPVWDNGQWVDGGAGQGFGSRRNEQALAIGLAVEIPNTKLAVQLEYAHGWNQGFNKYLNSDNVNFGLSYRLTPFLTLFGQAEWLHVKDRSWMAANPSGGWSRDNRNNRLHRFLVGAEYEVFRGLTLEAGWQYEYWNITSDMSGPGFTRDERSMHSNMVYMGTRFVF